MAATWGAGRPGHSQVEHYVLPEARREGCEAVGAQGACALAGWPAAACHLVGRPDLAAKVGAPDGGLRAAASTAADGLTAGFAAGTGTVLSDTARSPPAAEASEQARPAASIASARHVCRSVECFACAVSSLHCNRCTCLSGHESDLQLWHCLERFHDFSSHRSDRGAQGDSLPAGGPPVAAAAGGQAESRGAASAPHPPAALPGAAAPAWYDAATRCGMRPAFPAALRLRSCLRCGLMTGGAGCRICSSPVSVYSLMRECRLSQH